jgi:hypothetical protein
MKTIGIIVGTEDEAISKSYYQKNKTSLQFLKEYGISMSYIPYDYAILAEVKKQGEKKGFNVIGLHGPDFTLEEANQCDYIFSIFEGVYAFMAGGYDRYSEYMRILRRTKAKVYPSQKMQEFIIDKHKYMRYLKKKGYEIAPTQFIKANNYNIDTLTRFVEKNQYDKIIIKPELGAFKKGFSMINNPTKKKINDKLISLKKQGYKNLLLQPFLPEFNKYGEVKTYWVGGKHLYSYLQKWKDGNGVFFPQEKIEPHVLKNCHETAKQLLNDLEKDHELPVQIRIDFACCVNNNNNCREFFINEMEISPTIPEQESRGNGYVPLVKELLSRFS